MFADISFSTEGTVAIGALGTILIGAISVIFKLLMAAKDSQIQDLISQRMSLKEMGDEAIANLEMAAAQRLARAGKVPVPPMAPVVAEHSSPTTQAQQDTADIQTMRARLVAATLQLGLPAREAAELEATPAGKPNTALPKAPPLLPMPVEAELEPIRVVIVDAEKTLPVEVQPGADDPTKLKPMPVEVITPPGKPLPVTETKPLPAEKKKGE